MCMACKRNVTLLLLFTLTFNVNKAQEVDYTLFKGANVIQMSPSLILYDQDLLVRGDQIVSISPTGILIYGDSVTIIESQGQFLIPGLIDAHTHVDQWVTGAVFSDSLLFTVHGVTTVLNLRGDKSVLRVRDSLRSKGSSGLHPDLYTAANLLTSLIFLPLIALRQKLSGSISGVMILSKCMEILVNLHFKDFMKLPEDWVSG